MFGFSFSELVVVVLVALVVVGPKDLPKMLRRLGQWAGKLRRMAADLRAQSGIDDALRTEGLADDIAEIRKLARGELDAVQRAARLDEPARPAPRDNYARGDDFQVVRDREYPREGCDAYGAIPDNAIVYAEGFPRSAVGNDPLYMTGDENGVVPPPPPDPYAYVPENLHEGELPPDANGAPVAGAEAAAPEEPGARVAVATDAEAPAEAEAEAEEREEPTSAAQAEAH